MTTKFTFIAKEKTFHIEERSMLKAFARAKSYLLVHKIISRDEIYRWDRHDAPAPYTYRLHLTSEDFEPVKPKQAPLSKLSFDWAEIAESPIEAVSYHDRIYALGSELAVRRLAHHFRSFEVGCSTRLATKFNSSGWFFKPCAEDVQPH